jgi:UDP-N-acetylmuramate: L-alanyl-gamma-D-glutamyl-meso-diaminopimelate ligase
LLRTVPQHGHVLRPFASTALDEVIAQGCWTPVETFGEEAAADWTVHATNQDYSQLRIGRRDGRSSEMPSALFGQHNALNTVAAVATAHAAAGISPDECRRAIASFRNAKRRLELIDCGNGIQLYDDFAHHPTAIRETLAALRAKLGSARILAILEPRSNTMRLGCHAGELGAALAGADRVFLFQPPDLDWSLIDVTRNLGDRRSVYESVADLAEAVVCESRPGDHLVIMSNGGFGGLRELLRERLG